MWTLNVRSHMMSGLTASARILMADNGGEVTCEELYRSGQSPLVWSLEERKRLVVPRRWSTWALPMAGVALSIVLSVAVLLDRPECRRVDGVRV